MAQTVVWFVTCGGLYLAVPYLACQDSGSDSPAPTGSPAPSPSATPTMDGSTQQYYNNGENFVVQYLGPPVGEGVSAQTACTQTEAADTSPVAGSGVLDSGPTSADQAAWISGCEAGLGANTPASPTATPAATGSPTPAATGSPVGAPNS